MVEPKLASSKIPDIAGDKIAGIGSNRQINQVIVRLVAQVWSPAIADVNERGIRKYRIET